MQDIEVCRRPDGSEWVLGRGRHSQVLKAIKGGVQVSGSCCRGRLTGYGAAGWAALLEVVSYATNRHGAQHMAKVYPGSIWQRCLPLRRACWAKCSMQRSAIPAWQEVPRPRAGGGGEEAAAEKQPAGGELCRCTYCGWAYVVLAGPMALLHMPAMVAWAGWLTL